MILLPDPPRTYGIPLVLIGIWALASLGTLFVGIITFRMKVIDFVIFYAFCLKLIWGQKVYPEAPRSTNHT